MRPISFVRTGVATFTAAALSILVAPPSPGYADSSAMTLNNPTGPSGGGNILTATVNNAGGNGRAFPVGEDPTVQFQYNSALTPEAAACTPSAMENADTAGDSTALTSGALTVNPDDVRRLSTTKIAFTVPSSAYPATIDGAPSTVNVGGLALVGDQTTARWNVCVYDSDSLTTSTLIAGSTYTLAMRPRIVAIVPATAPTYGGQSITVYGAGFARGTTATIDAFPITSIRPATDGTSFTGNTPAHGTGSYPLVVKTAGGLVRSSDPDNNGEPEDGDSDTPDAPILFSFDSMGVSPAGADAGSVTYLDIRGAGFSNLTFDPSAAPYDPTAHVFLLQGSYDSVSNRGDQECGNVVVIDDGELVCQLDLQSNPVSPDDYLLTVVADGSIGATDPIVSSGAAFTVNAV